MNEQQIKDKLESMKKLRTVLALVTKVVALVAIVMIVVYNFMPVTRLKSSLPEQIVSAANLTEGFSFPGWQMIYWGCGGQFIMQDNLFNPNVLTIIGSIGTVIVLIVCTALYNRGKNKEKAIKEFVAAAMLIYSAFVLGFLILPVAAGAATTGGVYDFKNRYLLCETSVFSAMPYAVLTGVVLLLAAAEKVFNGVFLLYQKSFALKNAPKKN